MNTELLKGVVEIFILGLVFKKDSYGYEIAKNIKNLSNEKYDIAEGTLYPALKRLENKGYLKSYIHFNQDNKRKRKYYKITEDGKKEFFLKCQEFKELSSLIKYLEEVYVNEKLDR